MYVSLASGTLSRRFQVVILVGVLGLFAAGAWFTYSAVHISNQNGQALVAGVTTVSKVTTFRECVAAGYPVQTSYPEVCVTASGQRFVNN